MTLFNLHTRFSELCPIYNGCRALTFALDRLSCLPLVRYQFLVDRSLGYCYAVWSAIGVILSSVCPSVCGAVHCGSQGWCVLQG